MGLRLGVLVCMHDYVCEAGASVLVRLPFAGIKRHQHAILCVGVGRLCAYVCVFGDHSHLFSWHSHLVLMHSCLNRAQSLGHKYIN